MEIQLHAFNLLTDYYCRKTLWKSKQTRDREEDGSIEMSARNLQVTTTVVDLDDLKFEEEPVPTRQRAKTENIQSSNNDSNLKEHNDLRSGGRVFSNNVAMDRLHGSRLDRVKQVFSDIAAGLNPIEESDEI